MQSLVWGTQFSVEENQYCVGMSSKVLASVWWTHFSDQFNWPVFCFSYFLGLINTHPGNLQINIFLSSVRYLRRIPAGQKHQGLWKAPYFLEIKGYVVGKACPSISEKIYGLEHSTFCQIAAQPIVCVVVPRDICWPWGIFVPSKFYWNVVCFELSLCTFTDTPIHMQWKILVFWYSQSLQSVWLSAAS